MRRARRFLHGLLAREISAGTAGSPPSVGIQKIDLRLICPICCVESEFCYSLDGVWITYAVLACLMVQVGRKDYLNVCYNYNKIVREIIEQLIKNIVVLCLLRIFVIRSYIGVIF